MRQAVTTDGTVDSARDPSPSTAAHNEQITWLVRQAGQRWAWCATHDDGLNHDSVRHAAERFVKGAAQTLASSVLPNL